MTITAGPWARPVVPAPRAAASVRELARIPLDLWAALLADEESLARTEAKIYRRAPGRCHYWLGCLSSSGHSRVRLGSRVRDPLRPGSIEVPAHVYWYQASRGLLRPLPDGSLPIIRHRCNEASCMNALHLQAGDHADNAADAVAARGTLGPGSDIRGARGRAVAIRAAILGALEAGVSGAEVELAIERAAAAGIIGAQGLLF